MSQTYGYVRATSVTSVSSVVKKLLIIEITSEDYYEQNERILCTIWWCNRSN